MFFTQTKLNVLVLLLATLISNNVCSTSPQVNDNSLPIILVSVEPLYEIVSSLSHGIVKPRVIYLNFHDRHKPLSPWRSF